MQANEEGSLTRLLSKLLDYPRESVVIVPVLQLADLIERDSDYLAKLETLNNGKPLAEAVFDMVCAVNCLRYYAGWCDKIHGQTVPAGDNQI